MRSGELIRLTTKDIDNPVNFIRVISEQKNKEESRVPINQNAREIINRCIERNNKKNKVFRFKSQTDISHMFKRAVRKAGFEESFP
ncbi:MAG: tyrosine-type recombinase/integrase [Desulfobacterales bacterium]|nr:tyrosine-type recombinase/integrase [Desulfobacterales bacterium]